MTGAIAERVSATFGTDESTELVLSRIAEGGDARGLTGALTESDALALRAATVDTDVCAEFAFAGAFALDAEQTASLFESLCDYALGETSCDEDTSRHGPGEFCDCDQRNRAWSWASDIAESFGVEVI